MITREDIILVLKDNADKTQEEKRSAVQTYVNANTLTQADRDKIMADLESYEDY